MNQFVILVPIITLLSHCSQVIILEVASADKPLEPSRPRDYFSIRINNGWFGLLNEGRLVCLMLCRSDGMGGSLALLCSPAMAASPT